MRADFVIPVRQVAHQGVRIVWHSLHRLLKLCARTSQDGPPPPAADDAAAAAVLLQEKYNAWQRRVDALIVQSPQVTVNSGTDVVNCPTCSGLHALGTPACQV